MGIDLCRAWGFQDDWLGGADEGLRGFKLDFTGHLADHTGKFEKHCALIFSQRTGEIKIWKRRYRFPDAFRFCSAWSSENGKYSDVLHAGRAGGLPHRGKFFWKGLLRTDQWTVLWKRILLLLGATLVVHHSELILVPRHFGEQNGVRIWACRVPRRIHVLLQKPVSSGDQYRYKFFLPRLDEQRDALRLRDTEFFCRQYPTGRARPTTHSFDLTGERGGYVRVVRQAVQFVLSGFPFWKRCVAPHAYHSAQWNADRTAFKCG